MAAQFYQLKQQFSQYTISLLACILLNIIDAAEPESFELQEEVFGVDGPSDIQE